MGLNIKNPEVERLAAELAMVTGESKTEVIRQALLQRKATLALPSVEHRWQVIKESLNREVWSKLSPDLRQNGIPKSEQDEIFGKDLEEF